MQNVSQFGNKLLSLHRKRQNNMESAVQFQIAFMQEASDFLDTLPEKARMKIFFNADKVAHGVKDDGLFKKLDGNDDLWELRTLYGGIQYRFLAFWDEKTQRLVVATHGFVKKTWKVPKKEIARAVELRKKYYETK